MNVTKASEQQQQYAALHKQPIISILSLLTLAMLQAAHIWVCHFNTATVFANLHILAMMTSQDWVTLMGCLPSHVAHLRVKQITKSLKYKRRCLNKILLDVCGCASISI